MRRRNTAASPLTLNSDGPVAVLCHDLLALPLADQARFLKGYERIVQAGYARNPVRVAQGPERRGLRKQSKARNLLDRFHDHPERAGVWFKLVG